MSFWEIFAQTWSNLRANKLRSLLTMFGITWGIASVVFLGAVGEGFAVHSAEVFAAIGKDVIIAKDTPEFVFNFLLHALSRAALELLEKGIASKEDIDKSMTLGLGHPIGPIALMDFNGIDVAYLAQKAAYEQTTDPRHKPSSLLKKMMDEGKLGRKSGHGFYDYA